MILTLLIIETHQAKESSSEYTNMKLESHYYLLLLKTRITLKASNSTLHPLLPNLKNLTKKTQTLSLSFID